MGLSFAQLNIACTFSPTAYCLQYFPGGFVRSADIVFCCLAISHPAGTYTTTCNANVVRIYSQPSNFRLALECREKFLICLFVRVCLCPCEKCGRFVRRRGNYAWLVCVACLLMRCDFPLGGGAGAVVGHWRRWIVRLSSGRVLHFNV